MTWEYFLEHIDEYVEHVVEITFEMKKTGKVFRSQRYVWDRKEFGGPAENDLIKTIEVRDVRHQKPISRVGIRAI